MSFSFASAAASVRSCAWYSASMYAATSSGRCASSTARYRGSEPNAACTSSKLVPTSMAGVLAPSMRMNACSASLALRRLSASTSISLSARSASARIATAMPSATLAAMPVNLIELTTSALAPSVRSRCRERASVPPASSMESPEAAEKLAVAGGGTGAGAGAFLGDAGGDTATGVEAPDVVGDALPPNMRLKKPPKPPPCAGCFTFSAFAASAAATSAAEGAGCLERGESAGAEGAAAAGLEVLDRPSRPSRPVASCLVLLTSRSSALRRFSMRSSSASARLSASSSTCPDLTACRSFFTVNDCFSVALAWFMSFSSSSCMRACSCFHTRLLASTPPACCEDGVVVRLGAALLVLSTGALPAALDCADDPLLSPVVAPLPWPPDADLEEEGPKPRKPSTLVTADAVELKSSWREDSLPSILFSFFSSCLSTEGSTAPLTALACSFLTTVLCFSVADAVTMMLASRSKSLLVRLRHSPTAAPKLSALDAALAPPSAASAGCPFCALPGLLPVPAADF
mmetsp:Transcript_25075/g.63576  ORF Transcript_25075/g.63576 Transcript_25075/m.63576 type:complete len:517 (-) Transcript_25075:1233-2783(-)